MRLLMVSLQIASYLLRAKVFRLPNFHHASGCSKLSGTRRVDWSSNILITFEKPKDFSLFSIMRAREYRRVANHLYFQRRTYRLDASRIAGIMVRRQMVWEAVVVVMTIFRDLWELFEVVVWLQCTNPRFTISMDTHDSSWAAISLSILSYTPPNLSTIGLELNTGDELRLWQAAGLISSMNLIAPLLYLSYLLFAR